MLRSDERLFFGFGAELRAAVRGALRSGERSARACSRTFCKYRMRRGGQAESENGAVEHEAQCNRAEGSWQSALQENEFVRLGIHKNQGLANEFGRALDDAGPEKLDSLNLRLNSLDLAGG